MLVNLRVINNTNIKIIIIIFLFLFFTSAKYYFNNWLDSNLLKIVFLDTNVS